MEFDRTACATPAHVVEPDGSGKDTGKRKQVRAALKNGSKTGVRRYPSRDWAGNLVAEAARAVRDLPLCCSHDGGYTYMVRSSGLLKIGRSTDLANRMAGLQNMCPVPLSLLAIGRSTNTEGSLHQRFSRQRRHGEWFSTAIICRWVESIPRDLCLTCGDEWSDWQVYDSAKVMARRAARGLPPRQWGEYHE